MLTYADAEASKDKQAMARIRDAEKKSGFKTGLRFSDRGCHLVQVSFYPSTKWWITDAGLTGKPIGERRPMTAEEFQATRGLAL